MRLPALLVACVILACSKPDAKAGADSDSMAATAVAEEDTENPACDSVLNYTPNAGFLSVSLDSEAAAANRLIINVIKEDGQPFRAKLLASTGAVECKSAGNYVAFRVRDPQSFLSVVIHTPTEHVGILVKGLARNSSTLAMRAFGSDNTQQELVWNGAPRAFEQTPLIDDGSGPQRNPNIGKPLIHRPRRP